MKKIDKDITISKARLDDISKIVNIHKECVLKTNATLYPNDTIKEWIEQINVENTKSQFENSYWFVLKIKNELVGFCQFSFEEKSLYQINISPKHQNKGYGKILFDFIENQFLEKGLNEISLNSTLNAVDFYKRLGFKEIRKIKFKLDETSVEMVEMTKRL